ncbi:putative cytosol aminopeptidase [Auxenochlorella protothecoides]|uniref:Putative cytosol aminopeptidase n=1 Tax=Auxenochlorella protothecoides TaxID=3075 RepID=A0A087SBL3_AUXPR|nr:putative cytosol aminopeptidase [Auxenochlorella protothecoides]KFM23117.1 putative cytosol aminopeptidase [Auxenochlorella protothecoides]
MPGRQTCWVHATAASPSGQEVYSNFDQRLRAEEHVLTSSTASHTALHLVTEGTYEHWLREQPESRRAWLRGIGFDPKDRKMAHLPSLTPDSDRHEALVAIESMEGPWAATASLAWALERYSFLRYKDEAARKAATAPRRLVVPPSPAQEEAGLLAAAIYLVRDLINTPAEDLTPAHLAAEAEALAAEHPGASLSVVSGDALLHADSFFPMVHAVGRAAACPPHLLDLRWQPAPQSASLPLLVLVGKGVTFDSGGLNIKPAAGMRLMKKDMGGAALVLGLAHVIMQAQLPVRLRVLVPAVENAVGPASFRPGDVLRSRAGRSVE